MTGQQRVRPAAGARSRSGSAGTVCIPVTPSSCSPGRGVPRLMDDLVAFLDRDDVPPLALGALAHAQFETIHPFADGNGRTGRALLHASLLNTGVIHRVTVPISAGLLVAKDRYFAASARTEPAMPSRSSGASPTPPAPVSRWASDSLTACARCRASGTDVSRRARTPRCGPSPTCCCASQSSRRGSSWRASTPCAHRAGGAVPSRGRRHPRGVDRVEAQSRLPLTRGARRPGWLRSGPRSSQQVTQIRPGHPRIESGRHRGGGEP